MNSDFSLTIAEAKSSASAKWDNITLTWNELVARLHHPIRRKATRSEYIQMTPQEKAIIKDVGGYVGGFLKNGERTRKSITCRYLITLDIDYATTTFWELFQMQFKNAAVIHQTVTHTDKSPRYRLIMPLNRAVTPEEYQAISRKLAGGMGIDAFDPTTFQAERMMYWPTALEGEVFYIKEQQGEPINADSILAEYQNWTDVSLWPTTTKLRALNGRRKQEDPTKKDNIVGSFCRAYPIDTLIRTHLADDYEQCGEDRYTYKEGSTTGGLVIYDKLFAYSNHSTDPSSGQLCNAFDLLRLHKYGDLDSKFTGETHNSPSYAAMLQFAQNDTRVKRLLGNEAQAKADLYFKDALEGESKSNKKEDPDAWKLKLKTNKKGKYEESSQNINLIFNSDPVLKGVFKKNEFDGLSYVMRSLPWRKIEKAECIRDVDFAGARNYLDYAYGIAAVGKINDALVLAAEKLSFHPVRDYLDGLKWDGTARIERFMRNYFRTEDTAYTREILKKTMCGAVARIYKPGTKFDLMLVLIGPSQGEGKSTFARRLGKGWASSSFSTVNGKESFEQLRGKWVLESAELSGLRKAEAEQVKNFITKEVDSYRPAYGRVVEEFPRQCVFIGTTNEVDFLKDPTGDRRFMPVVVKRSNNPKYNVWADEFDQVLDQMWAEAVQLYKDGEPLILSPEAEAIAHTKRESHTERDERYGLILQYVEQDLPVDWDTRDIGERRMWLKMKPQERTKAQVEPKYKRETVTSAEVFCEVMERDFRDMKPTDTREINRMLRSMVGWTPSTSIKTFPIYGRQRHYIRVEDEGPDFI